MDVLINNNNYKPKSNTQSSKATAELNELKSSNTKTGNHLIVETYCLCETNVNSPENEDDMMIECDVCKDWLHGKCVNLNTRLAADIETYVCPRCVNDGNKIICNFNLS